MGLRPVSVVHGSFFGRDTNKFSYYTNKKNVKDIDTSSVVVKSKDKTMKHFNPSNY